MREKETMAKKSKTQRAKASAARQARKAQAAELEAKGISAEEVEAQKKAKKQRFKFLKEVRSELKRVTWPTRNEVLRWTGVVVGALLFFGIFVAVLDNLIVTPIVVGISSIGAGV